MMMYNDLSDFFILTGAQNDVSLISYQNAVKRSLSNAALNDGLGCCDYEVGGVASVTPSGWRRNRNR